MKTLLLIDANSLIHRTFHALPPLISPDGRATQSLYGLSNILLRIFREDKPDYAAALFDRPEPTLRKERYEAYKAQRPKAPDDLVSQIIEAHTLFEKFGIKYFEKPGYEADDLIATIATKFLDEKDLKIIILTGDLDTLQMAKGDKLVIRTFRKGISDTFVYDEAKVRDRYGLEPAQLVDYKALVGDASDNIKGVPGIGEKTATALLQKYGTLEGIYENLENLSASSGQVEPRVAKKLKGTREQAEFSKSLVVLERAVPIKIGGIEELKPGDKEGLEDYFKDLGFESLVKRLRDNRDQGTRGSKNTTRTARAVSSKRSVLQISMFENKEGSVKKGEAVLIEKYEKGFKDYFSAKLKVGFGLKGIIKEAVGRGEDILPPYFDLGVGFWLLDSDFREYSPEAVFRKFIGRSYRGGLEELGVAFGFVARKLKEYEVMKIFEEIEMPLLRILAEMENFGVKINIELLKRLEVKLDKDLDDLTKKIHKLAGKEFNVNSSQQLSKILFEDLGLDSKLAKKTAGGAVSTREESLLALKGEHEIVGAVLEYREGFKIMSTYVKPFQDLLDENGRVHTEFLQTGTATGRLSSQAPNMQNIPQESIWARDFRSAFVAEDGFSLISFDYSQIELRILASLSGDEHMKKAFRDGKDIHAITASKILGVPEEKVRKEERRLAKVLNFGLIYGMGVSAFQKTSGLKRSEAQKFIDNYFKQFSKIKEWQEKIKEEARSNGYVKNLNGRRRYLPEINSSSLRFAAEAERAAINQPIQGFSADLIKMAMIQSYELLRSRGWWGDKAKLTLSIHDELLFEVRDDMIEEVGRDIKKVMEGVFDLGIPLKVEVASGKNLGDLAKLKI